MPDDRDPSAPGPDAGEPEEEQEEQQPARRNATPDYRKFAGNPWWKRRWVQSYLWPAGVIAFAAVVLISRTASVVKTAFQPSSGRDTSVGELRQDIRGNLRRPASRLSV
jgi:hypothetical protein